MFTLRHRIAPSLAVLIVAALIGLVGGVSSQTADATALQQAAREPGLEAQFIAAVNQTRAQYGSGPLRQHGGLSQAAVSWTNSMVTGTFLAHASDIVSGAPSGWAKVGENVGRGQTVTTLMTAFMNSPTHRANLLDPAYTHIGVGVYIHPNGRVYTAHRFAAVPGAAAVVQQAPQPVADPAPTAAPEPTAAPQPTATPEPTAAPQPTATPEPTAGQAEDNAADAAAPFGEAPGQLAFAEATSSWLDRIERLAAKRDGFAKHTVSKLKAATISIHVPPYNNQRNVRTSARYWPTTSPA